MGLVKGIGSNLIIAEGYPKIQLASIASRFQIAINFVINLAINLVNDLIIDPVNRSWPESENPFFHLDQSV